MNGLAHILSENERIFWLCPRGEIVAGDGTRLGLDGESDRWDEGSLTWETALSSLNEFVAGYHPPIIFEHKVDGFTYGEVVRVVGLTEEEQLARGIPAERIKGEAAFAVANLHPLLADAYDDGRLTRTSPHLAMGYLDSAGKRWPLAVLELSAVSKPRQTSRHITTNHLRGVMLSESSPRITMSASEEGKVDEAMEKRLAALEETAAKMAAFMEKYMEGDGGEDDDPPQAQAAEEDPPQAQASEPATAQLSEPDARTQVLLTELSASNEALTKKVEQLENERNRAEAAHAVDAAYAERHLAAEKRDRYIEIYLSDKAAFEEIVAAAPKANRITRPVVGAAGKTSTHKAGSRERYMELKEEHDGDSTKAHQAWLAEQKEA